MTVDFSPFSSLKGQGFDRGVMVQWTRQVRRLAVDFRGKHLRIETSPDRGKGIANSASCWYLFSSSVRKGNVNEL